MGNGATAEYEDIDAGKITIDFLRQLLDVLIASEVGAADVTLHAAGTELFGNRFEGFTAARHQADLSSLGRKGNRNGFADATAGSGYNRELIP
jgi:hypothetical protein